MIRIAILSTDVRPVSGWGAVTYDLCMAFSERKDIKFRVFLPRLPHANDLPFGDHLTQTLPDWAGSFRSVPHKVVPFVFPRMELQCTDIVHAVVEFPYAILAWRVAYKTSVPFIISTHGTYGVAPFLRWPERMLYKQAFRQAAAITAPSCFTAQAVRRISGIERPIQVIHNPIHYARFQKLNDLKEIRCRYDIPEEARVILSVGALKGRKGFDVLVKAFARVISEEPRMCLVIVGKGPADWLSNLARSVGVQTRTHLLGEVPENDLIGLYQMCEIFTLLPRKEGWNFEGFGIVYLEAGACGKPVVGTRSGGVVDAVRDGETGLLVNENDHEAAAAAILRLITDTTRAQQLGQAGRKWAAEHDRLMFAERLMSLYVEVATRF